MSEGYRDWTHPNGALPETAPEGLVDVYTAPWLAQRAGEMPTPADEGSLAGLAGGAVVLLLLVGWWFWRHRAELRLWWALWRLEREASRIVDAAARRALQDEVIRAIGRWQHRGRAPWRQRLPEPWSVWVREIDHARFGHSLEQAPDAWRNSVVERLRAMRRAVWRRESA